MVQAIDQNMIQTQQDIQEVFNAKRKTTKNNRRTFSISLRICKGFKRQIDHLHQDLSKLERKTDTVIYWIIGGAFTTILTLVGLFNLFIN